MDTLYQLLIDRVIVWIGADERRIAGVLISAALFTGISAAATFIDNLLPGKIDSRILRAILGAVRIFNRILTPQGAARSAAAKLNPASRTARRDDTSNRKEKLA